MHSFHTMFRLLARFGTRRMLLLVGLLFLNSLLEGLGLATLVPLLVLVLGVEGEQMPAFARQILDIIAWLGLPQEIWLLTGLTAGLLVLREIFGFFIQLWAGYVITDIANDMRRRLLAAVIAARWPWYQDNRVGGMAISIAQFTTNASAAMEQAMRALVLLLRTLVYIGLVMIISPALAAGIAVLALLIYGPLMLLVRMMRKYSHKYAGSTEALSAHFADSFSSIKMIKAMGLEQAVQPLLVWFIRRLRRFRRRMLAVYHGLTALQNILSIILVFAVLYVALRWLDIPAVEVGIVAGLALSVVKNLSRLQKLIQAASEYAPYFDKVDDLTRSAEDAREQAVGSKPPSLRQGIRLANVSFAHPGRSVLNGLDIFLPAHAISVIIGPSGAGKTTIIDLITGLQRPQSGEILVDDTPLEEIDLKAWRRMIGYVPQELILLSGTVRDNIRLGQEVSDEDIWRALELAGAAEFVRQLPDGLDTDLGERGVKLSGGQRQRLSLARALVRKPKLLILDEVTSALDPQTEQRLVDSITALARRENITVIAITHTDAWRNKADVLLRLQDGKATIISSEEASAKGA